MQNSETKSDLSSPSSFERLLLRLEKLDRRVVYLGVAFILGLTVWRGWSLPPAEMHSATSFYEAVDAVQPQPGKIVLIAADWSANTMAENKPQTEVAIEHLMRKRIPFALVSLLPLSTPFLECLPRDIAAKLSLEQPGQDWVYGKDWVNLGYKPNPALFVQGMAKAEDLKAVWKTDYYGTPLAEVTCLKDVKTIRDVSMLMEFTGSVGLFNLWLQFFQVDDYRPPYVHGCTSITITEAHIYLSSGQIVGLHEGVAGAAWYEELLNKNYHNRKAGTAIRTNTTLAVGQLLIMFLIFLGNLRFITHMFSKTRSA